MEGPAIMGEYLRQGQYGNRMHIPTNPKMRLNFEQEYSPSVNVIFIYCSKKGWFPAHPLQLILIQAAAESLQF
jgi:hypothetical protein